MIGPVRAWELEQNDRRCVFVSDGGATMFAEEGAFGVTRHRHPAWKAVLPLGGRVEVGLEDGRVLTAAGAVLPPELAHTCATTSSYVAVFVDPWTLRPGPGPVLLDAAEARRLLDALGCADAPHREADLQAAETELAALVGEGSPPDPRVVHALREAADPDSHSAIAAIAADVGVSPPRLRALARETVGIPLVRLRQWARLRAAVADLSSAPPALAAASAGFADQAHLTRTARSLLGRTPSSLGRHVPPTR